MRISDWSSDVCSSDLVIGVVPAHFKDTGAFTLPFDRFHKMCPAGFHALVQGGPVKVFAGFEVMADFPEDPGVSNGGTTDHDAVHLVCNPPCRRFFYRVYIAVPENGNTDQGGAPDFPDECPVGRDVVQMGTGEEGEGERKR